MKATRTLPETYVPYSNFRPSRFKRTLWVIWLFGLLVAAASFAFFSNLSSILRPEFQPMKRLHFEIPTLDRLRTLPTVAVSVAVILIVHEFIHALCLWILTRERPLIVAKGGGLCVRLPSWYLSRNAFLISNLAPVCLITLAGLLLLPIVPQTSISLLVFCTAMNIAASTADMASSVYILLHPRSVYLDTDGTIYTSRSQGFERAKWRQRLRSSIEWILAKLE